MKKPNKIENYDFVKGWDNTNPKWHSMRIRFSTILKIEEETYDILNWVYDNIDNPERHARWRYSQQGLDFKFRHEHDYIWFKMRWSG